MRSFKDLIRVSTSEAERFRVYSFRYHIYIEEMVKPYRNADHQQKLLTDPLDEGSTLLYAEEEGEVIGTLRINWGDSALAFDNENFALSRFPDFRRSTFSFCTRLMVSPKFRRTMLTTELAETAYRCARERGVALNFISCIRPLIPFFERLGYRRYKNEFIDPNVGPQVPLVLFLKDVGHLRCVKSPFYKEAARRVNRRPVANRFEANSQPFYTLGGGTIPPAHA